MQFANSSLSSVLTAAVTCTYVTRALCTYRARYVHNVHNTAVETAVDRYRTCANAEDGLKNLALSTPSTAVARL